MSCSCRARLSLFCLASGALLAGAWLTPPAPARQGKMGEMPAPRADVPTLAAEPVQLPQSPQARQRLSAARDYIKARRWPEAVRLLQALLDSPSDSFRQVPYRDARGRPGRRWVSARAEAEQLLAGLPAAGKDFYLLSHDAAARKQFADARARRDLAAMHEVLRRYRHTAAGADALDFLGSYYLDRGHPDLAAACYEQLLQHPAADRLPPLALFKAALAFRGAPGPREEARRKLVDRLGGAGLQIGGETFDAEGVRRLLDRWPAGAPSGDYPLFRGDAVRSAQGVADVFLPEPQWRVATAEGEGASWVTGAVRASPGPVLPGAVPIGVGDKLIYRSHAGVHALDAATGREVWRRVSPLSLAGILGDPGKKVQVQNWFGLYGPARAVLVENSTLGTLGSDGRRVYAVEDLALPPHPDLVVQNDGGAARSLGPLRHAAGHNRLLALDADTGAVAWEVGGVGAASRAALPGPARLAGPTGAGAASRAALLADTCFLGPPLPLGGQLFVLAEKQQEVSLVCLDAARGTVRWTQLLATAHDKILLDVPRRTQAAHLAYADGVLVCPTGSGAVLGVDPLSRSLLWARVYARRAPADGETPGGDPARLRGAWKACSPVIDGGRVVFTAPDADALFCLDLHDGSPLWEVRRGEDDLYVGCINKGRVLVVGKTACRALALAGGQTLWQRPTGRPSGQGVAAGGLYYLPLEQGAVLALNLEAPRDSARLQPRAALREPPANLVFHRGTLWSQGLTGLTAFTSPGTLLARIERRLARAPHDPAALFERGSLRLDRGEVAGAAADLHEALARQPPAALVPEVRARLFAALTQFLQRDFAAAENYLDEYRALCLLPVPAGAGPEQRQALEKEQRRRQAHALALLALGREKQGRLLDALRAYRDLCGRSAAAGPGGGELMTVPDDPAVQTRPDLWVRDRVAAMLGRATPPVRQALEGQVRREWQALSAGPDRAGLRRFLALYGSAPGAAGALSREGRLLLARGLRHSAGRRHALEAELLLLELTGGETDAARPALAARALHEQVRLLTRHGLLDEAVACCRRLAEEYPRERVGEGQTGAGVLDDLRTDKRFLAHLEPPPDPWAGARLKPALVPANSPANPLLVPCVPCRSPARNGDGAEGGAASLQLVNEVPVSCRHLRFTLDGRRLCLRVANRATGAELCTVPLPLAGLPPYLKDNEVCYQAVGHLLVLCVGPTLLGIDLIDRKVRWSRHVPDEASPAVVPAGMEPDGGLWITSTDRRSQQRMGLIGPAGSSGVFLQNQLGLVALDPVSGEVRWVRSDVPAALSVFGDGRYLFLADRPGDGSVRGLRAIRADDGVSVLIPEGGGSYARGRRTLGRHLLVTEEGPGGQVALRLYDPLTGQDTWQKTFPARSVVLESPDPRWLGVAAPDGTVIVTDLPARREAARLALDPRHLDKLRTGCLLVDRDHFFVALRGPLDPALNIGDDVNPNFRGGLSAVPVHGTFYAFDRATGGLSWMNWLPHQAILLERFEDLPVVLCSAVTTRGGAGPGGNAVAVTATRSLDKRTGKLLFNRETAEAGAPFHTLQTDLRTGAIDLLAPTQKLRHVPVRTK